MSVINSQPLIGASGNQGGAYNLTKSLRFRSSATAYLNRTPAGAGNRKTWTWSSWVKRGTLGGYRIFSSCWSADSDAGNIDFGFHTDDSFYVIGWTTTWRKTTQLFRDPSAWYHIVVSVDTTQATANNRLRIYVNGSEVTAFATTNNPTQNADIGYNQAATTRIGSSSNSTPSSLLDGYLAEVNFVDGQALTPSDFGETDTATGVWKPKKYAGTYGTNGFYLDFEDTSSTTALGYDAAGSNDWTVNNISLTSGSTYDSMKDVPTLTDADTANYCVLNPLTFYNSQSGGSVSNGNLTLNASAGANGDTRTYGTFALPSGKWYFETTIGTVDSTYMSVGLSNTLLPVGAGFTTGTVWIYKADGTKFNGTNPASSGTSYGATYTNGDVIGTAIDIDAGTIEFYKNNTSQGVAYSNVTANTFPFLYQWLAGCNQSLNFGQRPFAYTPPSGFKALNTFNLPTPTIGATASTQANDYFDVSLWTGNGSTQSITNSGSMQPDFVWIKGRSTAWGHRLADAVRGVGKELFSNDTSAELTNNSGGYLTAFNSNGFSINSGAGVNTNNDTYVAWQWKANGAGSSNTSGTISSTVSANTSAGFSIVTFVNASGTNQGTVGHGLGVAPSLIITKNRDTNANNWAVFHSSVCDTTSKFLQLNTTAAVTTFSTVWGANLPTSTVFGVTGGGVAAASANVVAYCFAEVAGYSAFGSYTGNGSTDGAFVFTGFRPKYILRKRTDTTAYWVVYDTTRNPYNLVGEDLYPNDSLAGSNDFTMDILSNGFKIRGSGANINASGGTYIYVAFAENPFKYSLAR